MSVAWKVIKFGGSSVSVPEHWEKISQIISHHLAQGFRPLVVFSAFKNVSNLLEALLHQAKANVHQTAITHLKELHIGYAAQLGVDTSCLDEWFIQLSNTCEIIANEQTISAKNHAMIVATGELLSSTIGEKYLAKQLGNTCWQDARAILKSTQQSNAWQHYTNADCTYEASALWQQQLARLPDVVITQGFIASDQQNDTVLLGREGSDTSASYLAAIVQAKAIEIWTDVPGVFTANPQELSAARRINCLTYEQAEIMAKCGAKVLHPRAIQPAKQNHIDIEVRCTHAPHLGGTSIITKNKFHLQQFDFNKNQLLSIAKEENVVWLVLPQPVRSAYNELVFRLCQIGFNLLLEVDAADDDPFNLHLIFIYLNTDKPQPELEQLIQVVANKNIKIHSNYTMLSLIGVTELPEKSLIEHCLHTNIQSNSRIAPITCLTHNRYTQFIILGRDCTELYAKLHAVWFNNGIDSSVINNDCGKNPPVDNQLFSSSWQALVQQT
ncbi:aspartate kinase [Aliikangiella maris]|uniref:Aspartokinase n=2 Tax=Aliikangiella maris TaxID=3162458 RepID=A0ABV3MPE1_9GAMM